MPSSALAIRRPAPRPAPIRSGRPAPHALGFNLFLLVNATLFVRPADVIPGIIGWEIYQYLIVVTLLVSLPAVLAQLSSRRLQARPITVCVLGLFAAIVVSQLVHGNLVEAYEGGKEYAKTIIYYLLLVGLVNTPRRLRTFLRWLVIFSTAAVLLALLHYHGIVHLATVKPVFDSAEWSSATGQEVRILRLTGTGTFQDPNDFCILVVVAVLANLSCLSAQSQGSGRWLWSGPLVLCLHALALTHSRGGLLALLIGVAAMLQARWGWQRALLWMTALVPVLLVMFSGRQTAFSASDGTAQERIQLWREGIVLFQHEPVFGIGCNEYYRIVGRVAHNSYLHAFTELGFFGGMLFLGAWVVTLVALYRFGLLRQCIADPELRRIHPYLMGLTAGYGAGMMSLTLCYFLSTYTVLGLATVFLSMARTSPPTPIVRWDGRLLLLLVGFSILTLAGFYVFVRLFATA
jgi:O-antigen ligase